MGVSVSVAVPAVCAENHVRSWTVTRFRGRISTQPGSAPIASFKVLSLEGPHSLFYPINSIGACVRVCVRVCSDGPSITVEAMGCSGH